MKSDKVCLYHIRDAISQVLKYVDGISEQEFYQNSLVKDAVIRNLEVIGEASKKVSKETRNQYPNIPWSRMTGMRDKLIHDYISVDVKVIWKVIQESMPTLRKDIEVLLSLLHD